MTTILLFGAGGSMGMCVYSRTIQSTRSCAGSCAKPVRPAFEKQASSRSKRRRPSRMPMC
jgi:hypothetical protein